MVISQVRFAPEASAARRDTQKHTRAHTYRAQTQPRVTSVFSSPGVTSGKGTFWGIGRVRSALRPVLLISSLSPLSRDRQGSSPRKGTRKSSRRVEPRETSNARPRHPGRCSRDLNRLRYGGGQGTNPLCRRYSCSALTSPLRLEDKVNTAMLAAC